MLESWLVEILVCPEDKGPLWYLDSEDLLYNPRLRRKYLISDGIPNLLVEEGVAAEDEEHARLAGLAEAGQVVVSGTPRAVPGDAGTGS